MADTIRIAVIDDWQGVAQTSADWSALKKRADITFTRRNFTDEDEAAKALADYDIILPLRERTKFAASLINRLPRLKMMALTGFRSNNVDIDACTARGVLCSNTGAHGPEAAAEMALALMLASTRRVAQGDAAMRRGEFQENVGLGLTLSGRTLGIIGLGRIGAQMARYGNALGMRVLAWSQNLTEEKAQAADATRVEKSELMKDSDAITLHLVLSARSRGIIGAADIAQMKRGALLINTSRGPLVEENALIEALNARRIHAALDVYDEEPLPADHPLRKAPNTVLTPHLGFTTEEGFDGFYRHSVENILAFLDGKPLRVSNPEVLRRLNS